MAKRIVCIGVYTFLGVIITELVLKISNAYEGLLLVVYEKRHSYYSVALAKLSLFKLEGKNETFRSKTMRRLQGNFHH